MNTPIRIKTFRSKTLQDAFQQIREEFGPDASILETKAARFGMFGRSRIEVTASSTTIDSNELLDPTLRPSDLASESAETVGRSVSSTSQAHAAANQLESPVESDRLEDSGSNAKDENVLLQLSKELIDAGIESGIVTQWIEAIRDTLSPAIAQDIWSLRSEVRTWIRDLVHASPPLKVDPTRQQVIALIGPPGAGKSTSLAKIAANLSMEHGIPIGVLSTDSYRLGSNYLLQNYAGVLGWSFEVAESLDQIAECVNNLSHCRIVLMDTRGCSPDDTESLEELSQLLSIVEPTETHLVIPSTCNSRSFLRYERGFETLAPNRMILTRLDEAGGLGAFFTCLQCSSLPVSYLANGQNIPTDLIQATSVRLAQQIMSIVE